MPVLNTVSEPVPDEGRVAWLEDFSYAWPGASDWTLRGLDLEILSGECHQLSGASGGGKTTLALAFKDLLPAGRQSGRLCCPVAPWGGSAVGLVLQNPETQILTDSVGAEVAFGLENLAVAPREMAGRVRDALEMVGLGLPFAHPTDRLSMGQKYRLLLAAQLVLEPRLLVIDEPAGQLDADGLQTLAEVIAALKERGLAVLLCEHRPGPLRQIVDRHWRLDASGCLQPRPVGPAAATPAAVASNAAGNRAAGAVVVQAERLCVAASDATPRWQELDFTLRAGERVLLQATNGSGKTTLMRCLAGLLQASSGAVRIFGQAPVPRQLRGRVGYMFQNPRRQLFETRVFDEVAFSLRRLGVPRGELAERVERTLEYCGIADLAGFSPHRLSYGQQHLVALATVLAPAPQLLLLDDPLAGLDGQAALRVCRTLLRVSEERGTALLWTSHQADLQADWCHRTLTLAGGALVPA